MLLLLVACSGSGPHTSIESAPATDDSAPVDDSGADTCIDLAQLDGSPAGYELCSVGKAAFDTVFANRIAPVVCTSALRDALEACDGSYPDSQCSLDAECGTAGFCALNDKGGCECHTSCSTDEDCGPGSACMCEVDYAGFGTRGECRSS